MSILAEPRRKQKISVDPQNVTWKNSSDTVAKKLMSKMNWKEGKGLGKHEQGSADNLKLDANYSRKGLGCNHQTKVNNQWISHHDDFASLLANLNSSKSSSSNNTKPVESIQSRSRNSKARVHYKFTRGKDLSLATEQQKQAIFGGIKKDVKKKLEVKKELSVEPEPESEVNEKTSSMMTFSTMSSTDYYKEKMAKWTSKKSAAPVESNESEEYEEKPKSKKRQRFENEKKSSKKSKKFLN